MVGPVPEKLQPNPLSPPLQKLPLSKRVEEGMKAAALIGFGSLASTISKERGKMIKIKGYHAGFNALSKKQAKGFDKKYVIGNARNLAKREVLQNKEDLQASLNLLEKMKSHIKELKKSGPLLIKLKDDFHPKSALTDGICGGIQLDNAVRVLRDNQPVEIIIQDNVMGAGTEAASYQAIYAALTAMPTMRGIAENLLNELKNDPVGYSQSIFRDCDIDKAEKIFFELSGINPITEDLPGYSPFYANFEKAKIILDEKSFHPWLKRGESYKLMIYDFQALSKELALLEDFKNDPATLDLTISLLELALGSNISKTNVKKDLKIKYWDTLLSHMKSIFTTAPPERLSFVSNPNHRKMFLSSASNVIDPMSMIAKTCGIKYHPPVTNSLFYESNSKFLEAQQLLPGVYGVDIKTGHESHGITLVIQDDDTFYILDPNRAQLKAPNYEEGIKLLNELISTYELPKETIPWLDKDANHHQIQLFKIEKEVA